MSLWQRFWNSVERFDRAASWRREGVRIAVVEDRTESNVFQCTGQDAGFGGRRADGELSGFGLELLNDRQSM